MLAIKRILYLSVLTIVLLCNNVQASDPRYTQQILDFVCVKNTGTSFKHTLLEKYQLRQGESIKTQDTTGEFYIYRNVVGKGLGCYKAVVIPPSKKCYAAKPGLILVKHSPAENKDTIRWGGGSYNQLTDVKRCK